MLYACARPRLGNAEVDAAWRARAHRARLGGRDSFIFRGLIRSADGADNIGTALLLEDLFQQADKVELGNQSEDRQRARPCRLPPTLSASIRLLAIA